MEISIEITDERRKNSIDARYAYNGCQLQIVCIYHRLYDVKRSLNSEQFWFDFFAVE